MPRRSDRETGKLKLLLVFLFAQGWRISDALRLQWSDIDLGEALVHYHIAKTDDRLTMPLHLRVLDVHGGRPPSMCYDDHAMAPRCR
jgi:integrase